MEILRLSKFNNSNFCVDPWQWGLVNDLISRQDAMIIREEIDGFDFERVAADRKDKSYCMELFHIDEVANESAVNLQHLIRDVSSPEYIASLEAYAQVDLSSKQCTTNIWKYSTTDFLSPHLDKTEKYLTHLIYFNDYWPTEFGGGLNILSNSSESSVVASLQPCYKNSVVIKTDERSWHSVSPVKVEGINRYCMQVIFWNR